MTVARSREGSTEIEARDAGSLAIEIRSRLGPPPELSEWPLVSIIVLNRDGAEHLRRLLAGLIDRTDYPRLELILVDNASSDESLDFIRSAAAPFPISILANAHNESFSDACNQGAELASGELLLFLNNDAEPFESGWLRELVACMQQSEAAAVGPTLIEPSGDGSGGCRYLVHQRGLMVSEDDAGRIVPAYRDHLVDPLGAGLGEEVETIASAAACLLIERPDFDAVGGFTHGYWYGPEDVDLALKLRERGLRMRCSGRSVLVHPPNSTLSSVEAEQRGQWMRGNRRLFAERWGPRVRREYELDRLEGGGLWAEPSSAGAPQSEFSRAELEALGFCLKSAMPGGEDAGHEVLLEELCAALRRLGHRCLVLRGAEVDDLAGFDHDVAVHFKGRCRYALKPAQLNVLCSADPPEALDQIECARYDLIIGTSDAESLVQAVEARAKQIGFRTRIDR